MVSVVRAPAVSQGVLLPSFRGMRRACVEMRRPRLALRNRTPLHRRRSVASPCPPCSPRSGARAPGSPGPLATRRLRLGSLPAAPRLGAPASPPRPPRLPWTRVGPAALRSPAHRQRLGRPRPARRPRRPPRPQRATVARDGGGTASGGATRRIAPGRRRRVAPRRPPPCLAASEGTASLLLARIAATMAEILGTLMVGPLPSSERQ
mmetsp:Transcript_121764/g.351580  ORF Transcript_121764/g.351580 Transcript_121764/m.351580 type:complete len:207 (+) Transcript_121764:164-784(+)